MSVTPCTKQARVQDVGILTTALRSFERAAAGLGLPDHLYLKLLNPSEKIETSVTPILPDGRVLEIQTFITQHSSILGPAKGGIRMTADVTHDDITGLAMEMSWKTSLIGIPFGGGKAGIRCDAESLSSDEKEIVIRSFTRGSRRHIGPELYVPAPDLGTNERDMGHIWDCISYSSGTAITNGCYVTGKPPILGGVVGRREATGKGVVYTIVAACEQLGLDPGAIRCAVQGFGNVGAVAAAELAALGAKIVAVTDLRGGVFKDDGLDIPSLTAHVVSTGSVNDFVGAEVLDQDSIFGVACDCFVPAATGSQIDAERAATIRARIVAEGANAPTTPEGDEVLDDRGLFVVPDILCNAGGVFVSYLEYTKETQREQITLSGVETRLRKRMQSAFEEVCARAQTNRTAMRQAAMEIAVSRVAEGVLSRGLWP
ncbi:MAG: glutamate dehydrogenase [Nitrospiraceae bacterium]|nr:glutamate dehydrogenase [Nitrospiraceae bacterium]